MIQKWTINATLTMGPQADPENCYKFHILQANCSTKYFTTLIWVCGRWRIARIDSRRYTYLQMNICHFSLSSTPFSYRWTTLLLNEAGFSIISSLISTSSFSNHLLSNRYSPAKTKTGFNWYQKIVGDIFISNLKVHYPLNSIKPVSAFNSHNN